MEKEMIIKILQSAGINFPVILDWGGCINRLPTLIVDPGQTTEAVRLLSTPNSCAIDEFAKDNEIRELLAENRSANVIIPYSGQKGDRIIKVICSLIRTREISALPILITEKPYVEDPEGLQFFIFISGKMSGITIDWSMVVPPVGSLPVVREKYMESVATAENNEEGFWIAAACFMFPRIGRTHEYELILETAKQMVETDENCRETDDLSEEFIEVLNKWQNETRFNSVYELPYLEKTAIANIEGSVFYDAEHLYIPEILFKEICKLLLSYVPIGVLKHRISEDGILKVDKSGGYTVKRTYYNEAEDRLTMRVMRFDRSRTNELGEMDFVTACEMRKEIHI